MRIISTQAIPTSCTSNHASNLLELDNGDLLCTWFAGSMEGSSDISVYLSRYDSTSGTWSEAIQMSQDPARSEQNPVLFNLKGKEIWLFYTAQILTDQGTSLVRVRRSKDRGITWSPEEALFSEEGIFVRQRPVVNPEGAILIPIWFSNMKEAFGLDRSAVKISRDGGASWETVPVPDSFGCVHMNIMEDGKEAFYRSRKSDSIYRSTSDGNGVRWSKPQPMNLPNNNSSIQARIVSDGRILIIFNDIRAEGRPTESAVPPWVSDKEDFLSRCDITERSAVWGVPRNPLVIASSTDAGASWTREITLESDALLRSEHDEKGSFIGDYSYPSILQTRDGRIHVTYSYLRDYIKHVILEL